MNYLKRYGINDEQINRIIKAINDSDVNIDIFEYEEEYVIDILNLFVDLGVTNLYEIIVTKPSIFCESYEYIKSKIDSYGDKVKLARLLNEDAYNLELIGLL